MTDIDKFHEWVETQSPLALREYTHAQAAWLARGELDAVRIKDLTALVVQQDKDNNNYAKEIIELTAKLDKAREALLMTSMQLVPLTPTKDMWESMNEVSMYVSFDRFQRDYTNMLRVARELDK